MGQLIFYCLLVSLAPIALAWLLILGLIGMVWVKRKIQGFKGV
jgi:hypothetical protein